MKFLVFTTDIVPLPGLPTSGTALRTFGIISGLRSLGHEVVVSVPRSALNGFAKTVACNSLPDEVRRELAELRAWSFDGGNQSGVVAEAGADAIICGHWPAMSLATKPSQALIIDLAGPHMLERHYQGSPEQQGAIMAKLGVLSRADHFIVSGAKQRLYFLSYLLRAQVSNPESRISEIVMPLDPQQPQRQTTTAENYPAFIFGGVFLPWQNPSASLRNVSQALTERNQGTLTLVGGSHPNYPIKDGVYAQLFKELSANPRVSVSPMLPYDKFIDLLTKKHVAVDLMQWNLERELAVTIRSTSYLWSGIPVIYNDYADLGQLIRRYDAGWCIPPNHDGALAEVLDQIYSQPELVEQKSRNARRLAAEVFSWDRAVQPILSALTTPEVKLLRETDINYDFPDNAEIPIWRGAKISQRFLCRIDGLSRVECRIATHQKTLAAPIRATVLHHAGANIRDGKVKDIGSTHILAEVTLAPDRIQNNDWLSVDLEPIVDSAGQLYSLELSSDEGSVENSASPWAVKGAPYPLMGLNHNGKTVEYASICLRTSCSNIV